MERAEQRDNSKEIGIINRIVCWLGYFDNAILIFVAVGIGGLAVILLAEAFSDFYYYSTHSFSHIVGELMFVLILLELLRQVVRQLNRQPFSLNPFLYIGVIASVRGILVALMKSATGEMDTWVALAQIGTFAFVVLCMVIGQYLFTKGEHIYKAEQL